jgi:hypothetical protein
VHVTNGSIGILEYWENGLDSFLGCSFLNPSFQNSIIQYKKQPAFGAWIDRILHSGKDSAEQNQPISLEQAGNFN